MKMNRLAVSVALALSTTCNILAAAPPGQLAMAPTEADFFTDLPVVLSVARLRQNQHDVPGFVTVIDAEDIRHSGARDLAELLRGVPGFQVAFNPYGAPVASYHGLTNDIPKGLQVLIDGRTQYNVFTEGGVGWSAIDVPLEDIERIEVLRGSNSPAYGSNAFMGVVNVITRHSADTRGLSARASSGNQGIQDRYARIGFGGDGWSARIGAESVRDDGLPGINDHRRIERYNLRADADLSGGQSVRLLAGALRIRQGAGHTPSPSPLEDITDPLRTATSRSDHVQINWRRQGEGIGTTEVKAYRKHQSMDDFYKIGPNPAAPPNGTGNLATSFDASGNATRDEVEVQHTIDWDRLRVVGGASWREDVAEHARYFGTVSPNGARREVSQVTERLFGQLEWRPLDLMTANLGATWENDSLSGNSFAPRGALNVHATPTQTVKFIVSKSRRLPTLYEKRVDERLYETVGTLAPAIPVGTLLDIGKSSSGQTKPETVLSKEIGYLGEFRSLGLSLDARMYQEDVRDFIWPNEFNVTSGFCPFFEDQTQPLPPQPNQPTCDGRYGDYQNVIDATIRGWELQVAWVPTKNSVFRLAHARTKISADWINTTRAPQTDIMRMLPNSAPRDTTSLSGRHRFMERFTLSAAYYLVDEHRWTPRRKTDAYSRLDWRLAYDFKIATAKAELAWTVRADGSDYSEFRSSNWDGPAYFPEIIGTRHFVSLRVDY